MLATPEVEIYLARLSHSLETCSNSASTAVMHSWYSLDLCRSPSLWLCSWLAWWQSSSQEWLRRSSSACSGESWPPVNLLTVSVIFVRTLCLDCSCWLHSCVISVIAEGKPEHTSEPKKDLSLSLYSLRLNKSEIRAVWLRLERRAFCDHFNQLYLGLC